MDNVAIPSSMIDVSAAWLTQVLRTSGALENASVTSFKSTQIGAGVGIMGELFRITPTYDDHGSGPHAFIVKLPSPYEENRTQGVALGMYEAEVRFYNEMAKDTTARTPHVFHAQIRSGTADFVIVMEDLAGFTQVDELAGMPVARAEAAMETLARIHAPWWGRISSHEYGWIPTLDAPRIQAVSQVYPMLWQGFVAKFADMLPPGAAEAGDLIASRWGELMAALAKRPMTLLHQDFRCDNLFFDDANAGDAVVVIDWQAIGRGPGAYDLAYSLGGSLTVDDRRSNELALIRRYYDVLIAEGASNYSFEELWRDYQFATMVVTATPIFVGSQLDMANERGRGLIGGMGHRMFSNVVDHNATIQIGT